MAPADRYRYLAAELDAKAKSERNPKQQAEFENLAKAYRRLARQADQNFLIDIVYEPPPDRPAQQQQQPQPKTGK
jgi:hypothetical protein